MIAALYVENGGVYFNLPGIDPIDATRDARGYCGPYRVIAHPPCERWGRYWNGGPSAKVKRELGDDGGCFKAALAAVERWGGVLEHPEGSHAWRRFGIHMPPKRGQWVRTRKGWTCCIEQGHYGHAARKATWLYYVGPEPEDLIWGKCWDKKQRLDDGFHTADERRRATKTGICQRLSKRQRLSTPVAFRNMLIDLVSGSKP